MKKRLALDRARQKQQEAANARGRQQLQQYGLLVSSSMDESSNMTFIPHLPRRAFTPDSKLSPEQLEVLNAVRSRRNIFFTGSAGVGKSFLLKEICRYLQSQDRQFYVTAPTGIAAINIYGKTIHSWARLGKGDDGWLNYSVALQHKNTAHWENAKVLIIDEISMLSASFFEKLDRIGRSIRRDSRPFGGIQLILSGDFFQLPPVERLKACWKCGEQNGVPSEAPPAEQIPPLYDEAKWVRCPSLDCGYIQNQNAVYCFETMTWKELNCVNVVLTKVFRQSDLEFVGCLNRLRFGQCSIEDEILLKSCMRPLPPVAKTGNGTSSQGQDVKPTKLLPHRESVDTENRAELKKLAGQEMHMFEAYDELHGPKANKGDFMKLRDCPAPPATQLTIGCQVMLLTNLSFADKLVNGSRGVVVDFVEGGDSLQRAKADDTKKSQSEIDSLDQWASANHDGKRNKQPMLPCVLFASGRSTIIVPHTWSYPIDSNNSVCRTQIPLNLAWGKNTYHLQPRR